MKKSIDILIQHKRQLYYEGKMIYAHNKEVNDEVLLVQLLYIGFIEDIKELDLSKGYIYGIQFYKWTNSNKYLTSKLWDKSYSVYIHNDLSMPDIVNVFRVIGYKLKHIHYSNENCSCYQLIPHQSRLKKESQYKLFL